MDWVSLSTHLASAGPAGVILIVILGFTGVITGKVRLPREYEREVEARKTAESERDRYRQEAAELREQRNVEHEQKIRTLELLNAALSGRRQQEAGHAAD